MKINNRILMITTINHTRKIENLKIGIRYYVITYILHLWLSHGIMVMKYCYQYRDHKYKIMKKSVVRSKTQL